MNVYPRVCLITDKATCECGWRPPRQVSVAGSPAIEGYYAIDVKLVCPTPGCRKTLDLHLPAILPESTQGLKDCLREAVLLLEPMLISHLSAGTDWRRDAEAFIQRVRHVAFPGETVFGVGPGKREPRDACVHKLGGSVECGYPRGAHPVDEEDPHEYEGEEDVEPEHQEQVSPEVRADTRLRVTAKLRVVVRNEQAGLAQVGEYPPAYRSVHTLLAEVFGLPLHAMHDEVIEVSVQRGGGDGDQG